MSKDLAGPEHVLEFFKAQGTPNPEQQQFIAAFEGAIDALRAAAKGSGPIREYFKAWETLTYLYASHDNWPGWPERTSPWPLMPLPPDQVERLSSLFGYFASGTIPQLVRDCVTRGQTSPGPDETRHIKFAVAYIQAARAGRLLDTSPVKTVAECYGVSKRTVQSWQASVEVNPGKLSGNIASLPDKMRAAGEQYAQWGRSHRAIARRARKRAQ